MRINSKHYLMIFLGLISVGITCFGYWYVYNMVIEQAQKNSQILRQIEADKEDKKNEENLIAIKDKTAEDRIKLSNYFITDDKVLDFIKSVEGVGKDTGAEVTIGSIKSDDLTNAKDGTTGHVNLKLEVKGSWQSIMKSLILIENLPYSLNLNSLTLNYLASDMLVDEKINIKTKIKGEKSSKWNMVLDFNALTIK